MKDRIKWMLAGIGFTFGIQVLISLVFTWVAFRAATNRIDVPQGFASVLVLGFTLGAFLVGGFVVGWMNERVRLGDAAIVAVTTVFLTAVVYAALQRPNKGQFVSAAWLANSSGDLALTGQGVLFVVMAMVTAGIGAYIGWHMNVPQEGVFDRVALLAGLIGAVVGPFVLLAIGGRDPNNPSAPGLPWYFLVIVLLLVLVIIGVGFFMFARDSRDSEEISISPEHRR
jgi:MFS family permease